MKTPEEIKKGLECCNNMADGCMECPYETEGESGWHCVVERNIDALAYIQQLERERDEAQRSYESSCDINADYYYEIKQLEATKPKWISVEERLPERDDASAGELVLCICADGDGKPCAKEIHAWHYSVVRRMAQCFTHWMPLPEPPKEDC